MSGRRPSPAKPGPLHRAARAVLALWLVSTTALAAPLPEPPSPSRLAAFRKRLESGRPDADTLRLAREAIVEARRDGKDDDLRDALFGSASVAITLNGLESGLSLLREECWPASGASRAVLHLALADALVENARRFFGPARDARGFEREVRQYRRFVSRLEEAERNLEAAWQLRALLTDGPEDAFGTLAYRKPYGPALAETSRDTMTYAVARLLAKRESWRAADALERLPVREALDPPRVSPGDAGAHPTLRAVAVLRDLEEWHQSAGRRSEALRAASEAFRIAMDGVPYPERPAVLDAFEARVRRDRDLPAFSLAIHDLARLVHSEGYGRPEGRARARRLLQEGRDAYPGTEAARRCSAFLAHEGEMLELAAMSHDGLGKRSLRVTSRGVPLIHFFAYRLDAESSLAILAGGTNASAEPLRRIVAEGKPAATWTASADDPRDGDVHTTWVTPPLREKGAYVVAASALPDPKAKENLLAAVTLVLTDLALVVRAGDGGTEVFAVSGATGEPQRGVRIRRVSLTEARSLAEGTTGADGRVSLPVPPAANATALVATRGPDLAVTTRTYGPSSPRYADGPITKIVTDRRRYRPGEAIRFVCLAARRAGKPSRLSGDAGKTLSVTLADGTGRALRRLRPTTDAFGMAWGTLTIPTDRPDGHWEVRLGEEDGEGGARTSIEVENNGGLAVAFEPLATAEPGETVTTPGRLTGPDPAAVADARILWTLRAGELLLDAGEVKARPDGGFTLTSRVPPAPGQAPLAVEILVSSGSLRASGRTSLATRPPATAEVSLYIDDRTYWYRAGEEVSFGVVRKRGSEPSPGRTRYRIVKLRAPLEPQPLGEELLPPSFGLTASDRRAARFVQKEYPGLWSEALPVDSVEASGVLDHGDDGEAQATVAAVSPGLHQIELETDDGGRTTRTSGRFLVLTPERRVPFGVPWLLLPARGSAAAGKPWWHLSHCGFPGQLFQLEQYRNGRLVSRAGLRKSVAEPIQVPSGAETVRHEKHLWFVRDHQLITQSSPWITGLDAEPGDLRVHATRDTSGKGLVVAVATRGGKPLRADEVAAYALLAPPPATDDETSESTVPWVLLQREEELAKLETSLGESKGVSLGQRRLSPEAEMVREALPGTFMRLGGSDARDPESTEASRPVEPAPAAVPAPDPLAFQPGLSAAADGRLHVPLPSGKGNLWIVAVTKGMRFGFTKVALGDLPADPPRRKR